MERVAEQTGSCISTRKQDIQQLSTDLHRVISRQREFIGEDILSLLLYCLLARSMRPPELKRPSNKLVDEIVYSLTGNIKFSVTVEPEERSKSDPLRQFVLGIIEGLSKPMLLGSFWASQHIDRLSEEELGRAVERELEE